MIRIAAGLLIAPLFWPWVLHPVMTLVYIALTGTTISFSWSTPVHNLHFLWWSYVLIVVFGLPFVYFTFKRKMRNALPYLMMGTIAGFLGPTLYFVGLSLVLPMESAPPFFESFVAFFQSNLHLVCGSTVATGAMFIAFWAIGVRGNMALG